MATPQQEARLRANGSWAREFQVYLGAPWPQVPIAGLVLDAAKPVLASTTTTTVTSGTSEVLAVLDPSALPEDGGVVIVRKDGATLWFEVVERTSGTVRRVWGNANTEIAAGAVVATWLDITDYVTVVPDWTETEGEHRRDWSGTLAGQHYDADAMRDGATVILFQRTLPTVAGALVEDTGWTLAYVGHVEQWVPTSDLPGVSWETAVQSLRLHLEHIQVPGKRYGQDNLAQGITPTASPALGDASLEANEYPQGNLASGTAATNATDGKTGTLYISADAPSVVGETPGAQAGPFSWLIINEVFAWPHGGAHSDLQWLELVHRSDSPFGFWSLGEFVITTKNTATLPRPGPEGAIWVDNPEDGYIRLPDIGLRPGERIILCRNRAIFERYFGVAGAVQVYDWREISDEKGLPGATVNLDPAGDTLVIRHILNSLNPAALEVVAWGAAQPVLPVNDVNHEWMSASVPVPPIGASIRRVPTEVDSNTASDWQTEPTPIPGDNRRGTTGAHLSVDLGEWEAHLSAPITADSPANGTSLGLTDTSNLDPSGVIRVGLVEHIHYTSKDADGVNGITRGHGGTTVSAHDETEQIYQVDASLGATRLYAIEALELVRRAATGAMLDWVEIWLSTADSPAYPAFDLAANLTWHLSWKDGQRQLFYRNSGRDAVIGLAVPRQRVRHVMALIRQMSYPDPANPATILYGGRVKLNELRVWRAQTGDASNGEEGLGQVVRDLLERALPPERIEIEPGAFAGTTPGRLIQKGALGEILDQIAGEYQLVIGYTLDGRVTVTRRPAHPLAPRPALTATLAGDELRFPQRAPRRRVGALGQIIIPLEDMEVGATYRGRFPPRPWAGEVRELPSIRVRGANSSLATLFAQALFNDDPATSRSFEGETVGPGDFLHIGQRHLLLDGATGELVPVRLTSVSHAGEGNIERYIAKEWR